MMSAEKDKILDEILSAYVVVRPIKRRCSNATPDDINAVDRLVRAYNTFVGRRELRTSACSIPDICNRVRKLLIGHGKLQPEAWEKWLEQN